MVTGTARVICLATVDALSARGKRIVASDVNPSVHKIAGEYVATFCGDVAEEATAIKTMAPAIDKFGAIDIVVNNAARTMNKALIDMSVAEWDTIMAVNARGNFLHSREAVKAMIGHGSGVIVNVALSSIRRR